MEKNIETIPFWGNDPNILFRTDCLTEFFPTEHMSLNQKLNSLSRTIIILTIIIFIFTNNLRVLFVSLVTLFSIFMSYKSLNREGFSDNVTEEIEFNQKVIIGRDEKSPAIDYLNENDIPISPDAFQLPTSKNPLGNVVITDYAMNPNKKPAPPVSNNFVKNSILSQAKTLVEEANPGQPDISDKLFKDINDKLGFEQSLRSFNSNPCTTIPNDQGAFADFCYGSMVSCKEGNLFACARNLSNHQNI
jgi:hypothetical protein